MAATLEFKANIMDEQAMRRALRRVAHEIIENNRGAQSLTLVGIQRRGVTLARMLAELIEQVEGVRPPLGVLDITFYRDDLSLLQEHPVVNATDLPFQVQDAKIVMVDDVLYSGRTARAAMDAICDMGRPALIQLSAAVARGRIADIYEPEVTIASALFRSDSLTVSDSDLAAMKAELAGLKNRTANRATAITSPVAGVFTTAVDGYEHLDPSDLTELTPESLRALTEYRDDTEGNLGKVVTGTKWYFAALVSEADAARLEEGGTALLELGKYASGTVPAVVIRISHPSGGWCAVVFKCRTALNDTIALRELTADIVYDRVSGLRIPAKSVHVDEDGQTFVYVISAMEVEKKTVEVICSTGDYYIVSVESRADALRAGNEIIVSGRGVEEGLLLK